MAAAELVAQVLTAREQLAETAALGANRGLLVAPCPSPAVVVAPAISLAIRRVKVVKAGVELLADQLLLELPTPAVAAVVVRGTGLPQATPMAQPAAAESLSFVTPFRYPRYRSTR